MRARIIESGYDVRRDAYYGVFEYDGAEYYADVCYVPFGGYTECMIFKSENRQIADAGSELYCKREIPVTELQLFKCIDEFITTLTTKNN